MTPEFGAVRSGRQLLPAQVPPLLGDQIKFKSGVWLIILDRNVYLNKENLFLNNNHWILNHIHSSKLTISSQIDFKSGSNVPS